MEPENEAGSTRAGEPDHETTAMVLYSDSEEAVEWLNMCWRKVGSTLCGTSYQDLSLAGPMHM